MLQVQMEANCESNLSFGGLKPRFQTVCHV